MNCVAHELHLSENVTPEKAEDSGVVVFTSTCPPSARHAGHTAGSPAQPTACLLLGSPKTPEIQPLFCKWGPGLPEVRQLAWGTSGVRTLVGLHGFLMTVCDPLRHGQSLAAYPARESSPVASGLTGDHEGWVIFLT